MGLLKVWLREPHHTDDEAVKLVVDEMSDVSDILLRAPEFLRVQELKPSEIQAEYNNAVLSNRLVLHSVFQGHDEGTLVIRPRQSVVQVEARMPHSVKQRGVRARCVIGAACRMSCPLPSPGKGTLAERCTPLVETMGRAGSYSGYRSELQARRHGSEHRIDRRIVAHSVPGSRSGTPKGLLKENTRFNRQSGERLFSSVGAILTSQSYEQHLSARNVSSRFRQKAEERKIAPKRNCAVVVCGKFKPQWGKPLCVTCGHSKNMHWTPSEENALKLYPNGNRESNRPLTTCDSTPDLERGSAVFVLDGDPNCGNSCAEQLPSPKGECRKFRA